MNIHYSYFIKMHFIISFACKLHIKAGYTNLHSLQWAKWPGKIKVKIEFIYPTKLKMHALAFLWSY